jgi:hypothetical protein
MASTRQIEANRANAKMSTGPKSKDGKARSRMNSRKHGLTAKMLIIVDECADDFDELRTDLMEDFAPQSAMECELVERLAGIAWRLRRVPFFEAAILDARQAQLQHNARSQTGSFSRLQDLEVEEDVDAEEELTDDEWSIRVGDALIQDGIYGDGLGRLRATRQP